MSAHNGWQTLVLALFLSLWFLQTLANAQAGHEEQARSFFDKHGNGNHTNNWAVLVCASRYWFNYRVRLRLCTLDGQKLSSCPQHMANALGM